ncbi:mandelate racemase/muconate lactonizing enzyme family protein [Kribbella swartbergensis]
MRATIEAIQTARVSLAANPDLVVRGARGTHDRSDFLLVRVITSDGVEGYGEVSATPIWSGEDGETADHFVRTRLAPALVGTRLAPVGAAEFVMDKVLHGNPFTKAGVSTALWDAFARSLGVPLAVALGGPYRHEVPIKISLSGHGAGLERVLAAARAAGFGAFKVKVGLGADADVRRFRLARELVGPTAVLGADANGGWSRSEAAVAIRALAQDDVAFVEQPLAATDLAGLADLRRIGPPIVADESVFGTADLVRVAETAAADVVSVYVGKSGGPGRAVQLAQLAAAHGIDVLIGSNGELGLGAAAQLHVAAAVPQLSPIPSDIIGAHYYAEDILAAPLDSDGRWVRLREAPGLGVTVRDDLLKEFG